MCPALVAMILLASAPTDPLLSAQSELVSAKAQYLSARKSGKGLGEAAFAYGEVVVNSPAMPPREKYPLALALFRQTLKLDPNNKKAKQWEQTIVSIYKDLGRTVHEADLSQVK